MIWAILFIVVVIISAVLALRSLKDYQETPLQNLGYGIFYIRNLKNFSLDTLKKIYQFSLKNDCLISFERLFKGKESVLIIFAPRSITSLFPELSFLELEDYLIPAKQQLNPSLDMGGKKINLNQVLPWIIESKNNSKKPLIVKQGFLKQIDIKDNQRFFWQIVTFPLKQENKVQVTIRAMAVDSDPISRVELAKTLDAEIINSTGLSRKVKQPPQQSLYESYRERTLIPKEVSSFNLDLEELFQLLAIN